MNTIQVVIMDEAEARVLVEEIKTGIASVGEKLLEFYDREGWKALGYESWAKCVMTEFNFSHTHVYRLLGFAQIKQNILESPIGDSVPLPTRESQARPLIGLPPEQQAKAWQQATEQAGDQPTAKQVTQIVREIKPITKESQTQWKPKPKVSTGGFSQVTHYNDFNQDSTFDDFNQDAGGKRRKSAEEQAAIGLLEGLGYSVIPPEAADEETCAYCGKPFKN